MPSPITFQSDLRFLDRVQSLSWGLILLIIMIAGIGFLALYSAANGSMSPWASKQMARFAVAFVGMIVIALIDVRWWYRLAWPIYGVAMLMLVVVEFFGRVGMGAQRWIDLGFIEIQPSEVMKIALILVLARYFHSAAPEDMRRITFLIIPALTIIAPLGLVLLQPDLDTSLILVVSGAAMLFIAGAPLWIFISGIVATIAAIPVAWSMMYDFQKKRVLTFLNPELDPLGAGYHITQSKIALGSGGLEGKGFLQGSQSHLNFLPEKQTDFIFTLLAEEWGLLGGCFILALYGMVFLYGLWIAMRVRHNFGRYLALGLIINFSVCVFVNISMVMGLIPVAGLPLPLISYGGTAMLTALAGFGLIMSCNIYRDSKVTRV